MAEDVTATVKPPTGVEAICKHADQLFVDYKWREALDYLQQLSDTEDSELLWRLIRINYRIGKQSGGNRSEAKKFAETAMQFSERALALHENNFECIKWAGITLSWSSEVLGGPKMQIEKSYQVRDYWKKAAELKPDEPTVKHLLGRWCFTIAAVPWYAASLIASPPMSTYEEALSYFEAAEKVEPGFYCMNWLYLGKTHLQLGHKEEAREWLQKTVEGQSTRPGPDDKEARTEAQTLLRKL